MRIRVFLLYDCLSMSVQWTESTQDVPHLKSKVAGIGSISTMTPPIYLVILIYYQWRWSLTGNNPTFQMNLIFSPTHLNIYSFKHWILGSRLCDFFDRLFHAMSSACHVIPHTLFPSVLVRQSKSVCVLCRSLWGCIVRPCTKLVLPF